MLPNLWELIELLEVHSDASSLKETFIVLYPHVTISRADRFFNTCQRLAAPCKTSSDLDLEEYKQRIWKPRTRKKQTGDL